MRRIVLDFGGRQPADAIDILRSHDIAKLPVHDHAQQLGSSYASTERLFTIVAGHIKAYRPGGGLDLHLSVQVLAIHAQP